MDRLQILICQKKCHGQRNSQVQLVFTAAQQVRVCAHARTCVLPQRSLSKLPNPAFFYYNPLISNGVCSSVLTNLIFLSSICTATLCLSPQVIQVLRHQSQVCQKRTHPSSLPMSSLLSLPFRF